MHFVLCVKNCLFQRLCFGIGEKKTCGLIVFSKRSLFPHTMTLKPDLSYKKKEKNRTSLVYFLKSNDDTEAFHHKF